MGNDNFITVVSGIPRSGTSMMMRMLGAGGMRCLVDDMRVADEHNPYGYFECGWVKDIARHPEMIFAARGMCVKVISELLRHIPSGGRYKVVFMERNLREVVLSQLRMAGLGEACGGGVELEGLYLEHLASVRDILSSRPDVDVLFCRFEEVVSGPAEASKLVAGFLGVGLDVGLMASAVVPRVVAPAGKLEYGSCRLGTDGEGRLEGLLRSLGYL